MYCVCCGCGGGGGGGGGGGVDNFVSTAYTNTLVPFFFFATLLPDLALLPPMTNSEELRLRLNVHLPAFFFASRFFS